MFRRPPVHSISNCRAALLSSALAALLMLSGPVCAQEPPSETHAMEAVEVDTAGTASFGPDLSGSMSDMAQPPAPDDASASVPMTFSAGIVAEGQQPEASTGTAAGKDGASALPGPRLRTPVVVELFTAEGCSSCPPADALLDALSGHDDVLPLSFHVDYWDYLGWPDSLARPASTERQRAYARRSGGRAVWTPQMIVGGVEDLPELTPAALQQLVDLHRASPAPLSVGIARDGGQVKVELTPLGGRHTDIAVEMVRYVPYREVAIAGGENAGRVVGYRNVVIGLQRIAEWDGKRPLRLTVHLGAGDAANLPDDTRHALLVQARQGALPGAILAAVPLD